MHVGATSAAFGRTAPRLTPPSSTLDAFAARLREQIDLGALEGELLEAVRETVQPAHASLWLLFNGDFVFSVSRDFVRSCAVPMLVLPGHDDFHPARTAEEIARLAPRAALIERWRPSEIGREAMVALVREFLRAHTRA